MNKIDFRSDTVSWPTAAMRTAMANAEVGDDVYGEDPSVTELEQVAAEMLGFEAGLYVSSGTQGNLIAMLAHANRGDEAIVGDGCHTYNSEAGGMAVLGGIVPRVLPMDEIGRMPLDQIRAFVRPDNEHFPTSKLILLETTAGARHGAPLPLDYMAEVREIADENGLIVHLDGARIFNAATSLDVDVKEITKHVHSVSVCLSKGLCAPVGSVVVGSAEFIHRCHRIRKLVGSGMRQAGFIAAAGTVALQVMTKRLHEDHAHARQLGAGLASIPGIVIDTDKIHSNMLFFGLDESVEMSAVDVVSLLREHFGIWLGARNDRDFRAVLHYWLGEREVEKLVTAMRAILSGEVEDLNSAEKIAFYG